MLPLRRGFVKRCLLWGAHLSTTTISLATTVDPSDQMQPGLNQRGAASPCSARPASHRYWLAWEKSSNWVVSRQRSVATFQTHGAPSATTNPSRLCANLSRITSQCKC